MTAKLKRRLDSIIKKASKVTLPYLDELFQQRCLSKVERILTDTTHPRTGRLLSIIARAVRYKISFVPYSVRLFQRRS